MYAVVESGAKQHKVSKNDIFVVERLDEKAGSEIKISNVLLVADGASVHIGTPYVKGASVVCSVLGEVREPKVIAFKYKKRKSERKKIGHRRDVTKLQVKDIVVGK